MRHSRYLVAFSCAASVVLGGCSSGDSASQETEVDSASGAESEPSSDPPSQPAEPASATCRLQGSAGGRASLEQTPDGLVMTFIGLPVPASGDVLYSVTAYDDAGESGGQLGVKYQGGDQIAFFVFDFESAEQTNLEGAAEVTDQGIRASVGDAELGPLSGLTVASWSAAYSVDGEDVGLCPPDYDSSPFPG